MLQIHDKSFGIFIHSEEIQAEVASLAKILNEEYAGKELVFISVLNGAFMFTADLLRLVHIPCEVSFVKVSSYDGMSSSGSVKEVIGLNTSIRNKHVVILEDIVDSGITMDKLVSLLSAEEPAGIKMATLLFKPKAFKGKQEPDYIGFSIPDSFVVGYGLDYNEFGRNTEHIYQLKG